MRRKILCYLVLLVIGINLHADAPKFRVLVGSPIRQKPAILSAFLDSLSGLNRASYTTDYYFIDDNVDEHSSELLQQFANEKKGHCLIEKASPSIQSDHYQCDEKTHIWSVSLIEKVAAFKDRMIQYARDKGYDYLFLIDSDLVLHPKTVDQLIEAKKEIISNIFWTAWQPGTAILPQVWLEDEYTQFEKIPGETLTDEEIASRHVNFKIKMRTPGTYEVGGLGACTLIHQSALKKEISFKKIKNISFIGEDRHFCIRASALGIGLFVDTHYPAYHIYRESALSGVEHFKQGCLVAKDPTNPRITLSMVMRNEANRELRRMLEGAKQYITDAVIIDDASTDNSIALCKEILSGIPHTIIRNTESKFHNEIDLRMQQWNETIKTNPDWIVILDADEVFEATFHERIKEFVQNPYIDVYYFRLYDFWNETQYRDDTMWQAHKSYRPFLVRYRSDIPYAWEQQYAQHCGRFPTTCLGLIGCRTNLRLKYYGWVKPEYREAKYKRYQQLDPEAQFGSREQYESILDPNPKLITWTDETGAN